MNAFVVLQQMLVLFVMMSLGYLLYKKKWVDDHSTASLSKIVVNVFNPVLVVNGVLNQSQSSDGKLVLENLKFVIFYYVLLIVVGMIVTRFAAARREDRNHYQLMFVFSNVGFMGIPVMTSILGQGCMIYITFYILGYNLLLYTYGIYLAQKGQSIDNTKKNTIEGHGLRTRVLGMCNPGVVASIIAIIIYLRQIQLPVACNTFFNYVGNATIPLSMIIIGISVAKMPLQDIFKDVRMYVFSAIKMLIVPIACAIGMARLQTDSIIFAVFILMLAMPVGSIVTMIAKEYGQDEGPCSRGIILTTWMSIFTIPFVSLFL